MEANRKSLSKRLLTGIVGVIAILFLVRSITHTKKESLIPTDVVTYSKGEFASKIREACTPDPKPWLYSTADDGISIVGLDLAADGDCPALFMFHKKELASWGVKKYTTEMHDGHLIVKVAKGAIPPEFLDPKGKVYLGKDQKNFTSTFQQSCTAYVGSDEWSVLTIGAAPDGSATHRVTVVSLYKDHQCSMLFRYAPMWVSFGMEGYGMTTNEKAPQYMLVTVPGGIPYEFFSDEKELMAQIHEMEDNIPYILRGEEPPKKQNS